MPSSPYSLFRLETLRNNPNFNERTNDVASVRDKMLLRMWNKLSNMERFEWEEKYRKLNAASQPHGTYQYPVWTPAQVQDPIVGAMRDPPMGNNVLYPGSSSEVIADEDDIPTYWPGALAPPPPQSPLELVNFRRSFSSDPCHRVVMESLLDRNGKPRVR